jgi:RNA-directed DNA polymerase
MNTRGEAEGGDDNRSARLAETDRNVGAGATGASSAPSGESHCTGTGEGLIERMIERDNMNVAWKQVKGNKGAAGIDGLDIEQSAERIRRDWDRIKAQLLAGTYRPEPVRRVEIPKASGGTRKLGVPTVQDRLIQQAALQVLDPVFEPGFSSHSYGFRPGRSAHQAVLAAQQYQEAGKRWVVDIDLASFFDEVNHDLLMARVRRKIKDLRMLKGSAPVTVKS